MLDNKLLKYSFLAALFASSSSPALPLQSSENENNTCRLEALSPELSLQISDAFAKNSSLKIVRLHLNKFYDLAREGGESSSGNAIAEDVGDFLNQLYSAYKSIGYEEHFISNCPLSGDARASLRKINDQYSQHLALVKEKNLQIDRQLKTAREEANRLEDISQSKLASNHQKSLKTVKSSDQSLQLEERRESAVSRASDQIIVALAAEQDADAAQRQQQERLVAQAIAEIKKKLLKEKDRLEVLQSQMQFQELLDQKDFNIAGIASTSQIQDGAYDIEGMSTAQPFAQSEDKLELLKQIDSLKQKQQELISERIRILEMRMKLEGYDPDSYISTDPETGGDIPQPAKRAAPQRTKSATFNTPKPSSVDSKKSSFANLYPNARDYLLDGKASQALALLRPSASTENNNPEYHFLVGRAYQELKLNTESLESYSLAIHLNPQNHKYWINRGLIKGALKDPQGSLKDLSKSLSIKKTAMGYLNRGVTLAALNKPQEAIQDLTNAIEIDPSYSQAYRNRGIILKHRGDTFSACKDWKKANDLGDIDMKYWLSSYCSEVSFKF